MSHREQFESIWGQLFHLEQSDFSGAVNRLSDLIHYSDLRNDRSVFCDYLDKLIDVLVQYQPKNYLLNGMTELALTLAEHGQGCTINVQKLVAVWEHYPEVCSFSLHLVKWDIRRSILLAMKGKSHLLSTTDQEKLVDLLRNFETGQ